MTDSMMPQTRRRRLVRPLIVIAGLSLALAACTGPTPYQPLLHGQGYANQRLEANRFRVSFAGNSATPRSVVEDYLLYRAAEITTTTGNDYFLVVNRDVEPRNRYTYDAPPVWGYGYGWGGRGSGYGLGLSTGTAEPDTRYTAWLEILVFSGPRPADPNAYDAREVMGAIGPELRRPARS